MTVQGHRPRRRVRLPVVPARLRGLRPRLVFAFLAVALLSGGAATVASYQSARNALLTATQDPAMDKTRDQINRYLQSAGEPPGVDDLTVVRARVTGTAVNPADGTVRSSVRVVFGDREEPAATAWPPVPVELRREVRELGGLRFQRFRSGNTVLFAYGMPVLKADNKPSGMEVYVVNDLRSAKAGIDDLTYRTARFTALALVVAVLIALVAAQQVLRPVRELRRAARQLAEGKLDTRLRVRGADELTELVRTFNHTAAELEYNVAEIRRMEANARRFVADVSHELRTPLAAMTAVTDTLDEEADNLPGDAGVAAHLVSAETRRLAQLVDNLIEITRFDAGRAELRIDGDVDLAAVVSASLAARGWTDRVATVIPAGVTAEVDRRRVDVIVANLVGNAIRHGQPPITVHAQHEPPSGGPGEESQQVSVLVTDCGPGLPGELGAQVFERFYKADSARSRSEGSGLGLAIALENARLHGGTIDAANLPGGGAAFRLILPRHQPAAPVHDG